MDKPRKRRFGDRKDGRRLRTLDPYNELSPFIMKTRNDASNSFSDTVEITETERFLRDKRINGYPGLGILHVFIAAHIRVVSQYPAINRFISGQRIYARNNIEFIMTIKKKMRTDGSETSVKIKFDARDTIIDVYEKLNTEIEKIRGEGEDTSTDDVAKALMKLPRPILKFAVSVLSFMDYFGLLPRSLVNASPFHGSVIITDLGSIGMPPVFHHLYNFGNLPVFVSIGAKRKTRELLADGTVAERKLIDYTLVMDERCCDGFMFSQGIKLYRSLLRGPATLENPPETVVEDVD